MKGIMKGISGRCLITSGSTSCMLKLKECDFGKDRVKYLGHVVGSGELSVDEDKVVAVADWEAPTDIKGVQ